MDRIQGFSKLSRDQKVDLLASIFSSNSLEIKKTLKTYLHQDLKIQQIFDEFSENTLSNYYFPYGLAPNILINQKNYLVPMVIEESSVVAACARSANYWYLRGGFESRVLSATKIGQVHFTWSGDFFKLQSFFQENKNLILEELTPLIAGMKGRGGGVKDIQLLDKRLEIPNYFQIWMTFDTCDAMGANFINSVLESVARQFKEKVNNSSFFLESERNLDVVMSILSNYTPECIVRTQVSCKVKDLEDKGLEMCPQEFAKKFAMAVNIAKVDVNRAVTHNKGIFNGVDAVVLATGNDFRATEACGHAYAARDGKYRSLSNISLDNDTFTFFLDLPISIGTVGGLTSLHPLARLSLDILGRPSAKELMMIAGSVGLAQNFAALRSLVTTGIQKGHMKMHLLNILRHLEANEVEIQKTKDFFNDQVISYNAVKSYIASLRNIK